MFKVGVIGLRRGRSLLRVFQQREDTQVVAACDADDARLQTVSDEFEVPQRYATYEDLLGADVDAIVIATPAPLHAEHTVMALEAGHHVLCEVPAAFSLDECQQVVDAVERGERVYMLAENMNYVHYVRDWKERIQRGDLGDVFYAEAEYVHDCRHIMGNSDNWRAKMPPIYYCTHSLGPLLDILDDRCVSAVGMSTGCHTAPELGATDLEVGLFQTAKGRVLKVLCGFSLVREPAMHWQVFYGTKGSLENGRTSGELAKIFCEGDDAPQPVTSEAGDPNAPPEAKSGGHGTSEFYMVDDFVRAVRDGDASPIDVFRAMDMTSPGLCAHLSAVQGGVPIAVPNHREKV